jgi:hypothetical protein
MSLLTDAARQIVRMHPPPSRYYVSAEQWVQMIDEVRTYTKELPWTADIPVCNFLLCGVPVVPLYFETASHG